MYVAPVLHWGVPTTSLYCTGVYLHQDWGPHVLGTPRMRTEQSLGLQNNNKGGSPPFSALFFYAVSLFHVFFPILGCEEWGRPQCGRS